MRLPEDTKEASREAWDFARDAAAFGLSDFDDEISGADDYDILDDEELTGEEDVYDDEEDDDEEGEDDEDDDDEDDLAYFLDEDDDD